MEFTAETIRVNCIALGIVKTRMVQGFAGWKIKEDLAKIENAYPFGYGESTDMAYAAAYLPPPVKNGFL